MSAYMRDQFPFLGIASQERRRLAAPIAEQVVTEDELEAFALASWKLPEREYQYVGTDAVCRSPETLSAEFIDTAEYLITQKSWWDTVDPLASHLVGGLVASHPRLASQMDEWIDSDNIWLARTAILHQLGFKEDTDSERLFAYCAARAEHKEFFIRKAIGWALRQHGRIEPDAVRAFVAEHESRLSGLSKREALKHL